MEFGTALVVEDVPINTTPSGERVVAARLKDELKLLKHHAAAAMLDEADDICRGGLQSSNCGTPLGKDASAPRKFGFFKTSTTATTPSGVPVQLW